MPKAIVSQLPYLIACKRMLVAIGLWCFSNSEWCVWKIADVRRVFRRVLVTTAQQYSICRTKSEHSALTNSRFSCGYMLISYESIGGTRVLMIDFVVINIQEPMASHAITSALSEFSRAFTATSYARGDKIDEISIRYRA